MSVNSDIATRLTAGQQSTILALNHSPAVLGCSEATAERLTKPSKTRPALVAEVRRTDGWEYHLTDEDAAVRQELVS